MKLEYNKWQEYEAKLEYETTLSRSEYEHINPPKTMFIHIHIYKCI
jgi:hypothetical protein